MSNLLYILNTDPLPLLMGMAAMVGMYYSVKFVIRAARGVYR